jgi:hypothetical protein
MIPDYYDPRKVGELFLEDPAWIAKAACPHPAASQTGLVDGTAALSAARHPRPLSRSPSTQRSTLGG